LIKRIASDDTQNSFVQTKDDDNFANIALLQSDLLANRSEDKKMTCRGKVVHIEPEKKPHLHLVPLINCGDSAEEEISENHDIEEGEKKEEKIKKNEEKTTETNEIKHEMNEGSTEFVSKKKTLSDSKEEKKEKNKKKERKKCSTSSSDMHFDLSTIESQLEFLLSTPIDERLQYFQRSLINILQEDDF